MFRRRAVFIAILLVSYLSVPLRSSAQPADRIRAAVDRRRVVTLVGNRHPLARSEYDAGAVTPDIRLERMILTLRPDAAQERELDALLMAQQDAASPMYHQWLTPESFAERFGASRNDIARLVNWLGAQGFTVDEIPAGGRAIVFSGTVAQVQVAFHTAMHRYRVQGRMHMANVNDPQLPEALAGVAGGLVSLHDFHSRAMHARSAAPLYTGSGGGSHYFAPGDFATIYDAATLYANGIDGTGESIAIVARCNIPMQDVQSFRQTFGLPANNPTIIVNGGDPGITSVDELSEADLDVQWSGAVAPRATVKLVVSPSTITDGVDLSAQYIVSHNVAPVMSTSFGICEAYMGAAERTFYNNLWQQAAAQGITALVASGDSGAAGCDGGSETSATGGAAVNGMCSTPYSVCVGGTEFNEGPNAGQYWAAANISNGSSALSYIPETVWNEGGSNGGYGLWAGGGGASTYYSKPVWQSGPGVPSDGMRDVPDVSLTASGHDGYLVYIQGSEMAIAGTSAASPSFAGLMALLNQQTGSRQGNANVNFYALAALQAAGGLSYFHDVTTGNNTVPGLTGFNAGPGYDRASGLGSVDAAILVNHWTDATKAIAPDFILGGTPSSLTLAPGSSGSVAVAVTGSSGFNASVALSAAGLPPGVSAAFTTSNLAAPGIGGSTLTITAGSGAGLGSYSIMVTATAGSVTKTWSLPLTISTASGCTLTASATSFTMIPNSATGMQVSCGSVIGGFKSSLTLQAGGAPQGVTVSASPDTLTPGAAPANVAISIGSNVVVGIYQLTLTATGGGLSLSVPISLTIIPAPTFTLTSSTGSLNVLQGKPAQVTINTAHVGTFNSAVGLSVTGIAAGITASFSGGSVAAPGDGTSILTIQAGATAAAGTSTLTIQGAGGGIGKILTLTVVTQVPPAFKLAVVQKTLTAGQGMPASVNATVSGLAGGFNAPIAFSVAPSAGGNMPASLHTAFSPAGMAAPGSGTSILSFSPDNTATTGNYPLAITARGGGVTQTATLTLTITPPPGFSLKAATPVLNVLAGGSAGTRIAATAVYGFTANVGLSAGALPTGVSATFAPSSIPGNGGSTIVNVLTTSAAKPGVYTLNLSAAGGGRTAAVTITLNIGQLTVTLAAAALTIQHGNSASVPINTSITGVYSGPVALSATGLPKGVTAAFSYAEGSNTAAGVSMLKLTAASTAVRGTYTITVKAASDGLTRSATLLLTLQ